MLIVLGVWTVIASAITATLYVWDKRASIKDRQRISERTLLTWSAVGGWPGGLVAGRLLRHKTLKWSFRVRFVISILLNLMLIGGIGWILR